MYDPSDYSGISRAVEYDLEEEWERYNEEGELDEDNYDDDEDYWEDEEEDYGVSDVDYDLYQGELCQHN